MNGLEKNNMLFDDENLKYDDKKLKELDRQTKQIDKEYEALMRKIKYNGNDWKFWYFYDKRYLFGRQNNGSFNSLDHSLSNNNFLLGENNKQKEIQPSYYEQYNELTTTKQIDIQRFLKNILLAKSFDQTAIYKELQNIFAKLKESPENLSKILWLERCINKNIFDNNDEKARKFLVDVIENINYLNHDLIYYVIIKVNHHDKAKEMSTEFITYVKKHYFKVAYDKEEYIRYIKYGIKLKNKAKQEENEKLKEKIKIIKDEIKPKENKEQEENNNIINNDNNIKNNNIDKHELDKEESNILDNDRDKKEGQSQDNSFIKEKKEENNNNNIDKQVIQKPTCIEVSKKEEIIKTITDEIYERAQKILYERVEKFLLTVQMPDARNFVSKLDAVKKKRIIWLERLIYSNILEENQQAQSMTRDVCDNIKNFDDDLIYYATQYINYFNDLYVNNDIDMAEKLKKMYKCVSKLCKQKTKRQTFIIQNKLSKNSRTNQRNKKS